MAKKKVNCANAPKQRITRLQSKKQKQIDEILLKKTCSVKLTRIPPEELEQYMNNVVLVDVPYRRVTKRNKIDKYTFEERDECQEKDPNPVMQLLSNQHQTLHEVINTVGNSVCLNSATNEQCLGPQKKRSDAVATCSRPAKSSAMENGCMQLAPNQHQIVHEAIKTTGNSVRLNLAVKEQCLVPQKKCGEAVATCSQSTVSGHNEQLLVTRPAKSTAAENGCMQCFTYKQNIIQLKKQIKEKQKDSLNQMSQFDKLQDRCTQMIQKIKFLQEELAKYSGM